ncbi:MAG TPA: SEC-C domain-containing protein, partial [Candidatus Saccharimonadales bacterium]
NMTESEFSSSQVKVLPGLEYLQYLISRTPPKTITDLTEEAWTDIWTQTLHIIQLTQDYLMTRSPKGKSPDEIESLIQQLDFQRLGVRVNRYPSMLGEYWNNVFGPYDTDIQKHYGITASDLTTGLERIAEYQKRGIMQRYVDFRIAIDTLQNKAEEMGYEFDPNNPEVDEKYREALQTPELKPLFDDVQNKAQFVYTEQIFEITDIAELPDSIMDALSIVPGEDPLTKLTGPNYDDLSPLSTSPLHFKPFLKIDSKYYTFYHSGLEDKIFELIEFDLIKRSEGINPKTEKQRSDKVEQLSLGLLNKALNSDQIYQAVYYDNPDKPGSLTELDGMIIAGDNLMLIEVKSGRLSEGASRGAPKSLTKDIKSLILEGQRQSERAEKYIKSKDTVEFYDESGKKKIVRISASDFRNIFRVIVTNEQLGWIGSRLAQLSVLDDSLSDSMPWHISFDDLMAVSELFENKPIEFMHYLEARLMAAKSGPLAQSDEIDHVGLYHSLNMYHMNVIEGADRMTYHAYAQKIDRYFMDKDGNEQSEKPEQKLPPFIRQIIDQLSASSFRLRFLAGSVVLGFDQDSRIMINSGIRKILQERSSTRHKSLKVVLNDQEIGLSITDAADHVRQEETARCGVFMRRQNLKQWLIIYIEKGTQLVVKDVELLKSEDYTDEQISETELKIDADIARRIENGKIAKNQSCPCGSGERFKKCHGKR